MRNPGGYALWSDKRLPSIERDTFTCVHCNSIVIVTPKMSATDMGGWCAMCAKPVCKRCAGKGCTPFEKRMEAVERKGIDARRLAKILNDGEL